MTEYSFLPERSRYVPDTRRPARPEFRRPRRPTRSERGPSLEVKWARTLGPDSSKRDLADAKLCL
jgi:hypothetical protein